MKKNTYKIYTECTNCLKDINLNIPKGTFSKGYKTICPNCKCTITIGAPEEGK